MSEVEEIWEQICDLTLNEKIILYKRLKYEVNNRNVAIHGVKKEDREEY